MAPIVQALKALDRQPQRANGGVGMLFNFLAPLGDDFAVFNLFRFLTFRTGGAVMTAMILSFMLGPPMIPLAALDAGATASPFAMMAPAVT